MSVRLIVGDAREQLRHLDTESVGCIVTSPPYYGLRDYKAAGQIGLERTPSQYVEQLVDVFHEARRVLRDDGTLWLNLGDSYAGSWGGQGKKETPAGRHGNSIANHPKRASKTGAVREEGMKPKDLIGIPWMVAFALRADGWWLRQDIVWAKPNPMPESTSDRCTRAHEFIFMLTKSPTYFYDHEAIKTPPSPALLRQVADGYDGSDTKDFAGGKAQSASGTKRRIVEGARAKIDKQRGHGRRHEGFNGRWDQLTREEQQALGANKRSVWTVAHKSFRGEHFATFPPDLIEPCILAGCRKGDVVLDPFAGAGTTGLVADRLGRDAILIELNPSYADMARERLELDAGMFSQVATG